MFFYALRAYQIVSEGHYVRLQFRDKAVVASSFDDALHKAAFEVFEGPAVVDMAHSAVFPGDRIMYCFEEWRGKQRAGVSLN